MFCRNCGEQMNDNQAICLKCGVAVGQGKSFCANCGKEVNEKAAVCLNCGVAIVSDEQKQNAEKGMLAGQNKWVMAVLAFFLGGIGVHNFMMGETKKGIFKIVGCFLCGISCILALIDFIRILTDTYQVDPNKLI